MVIRSRRAVVVALLVPLAATPLLGGPAAAAPDRDEAPVRALFHTPYGSLGEGASLRDAWQSEQEPSVDGDAVDRITIVQGDEVPGRGRARPWAAMRAEIRPFDGGDGDVQDGEYSRAEVYARHGSPEEPADEWPDPVGATRWYSWSLLLPDDFRLDPSEANWLSVMQWKGLRGGRPPLSVEVVGDELMLGGITRQSLGPVRLGRWTHLVVGIHFRPDDEGWVEVWRDGRNVLPRRSRTTQLRDDRGRVDPSYVKQGVYRAKDWDATHVVFHGALTITDNLPSVWHHKGTREWTRFTPPG